MQAFWERKHDTHALLAWGNAQGKRTILLVFRGTASFANVLSDLSVSALPHQFCCCCHASRDLYRHHLHRLLPLSLCLPLCMQSVPHACERPTSEVARELQFAI